MQTIKHLPKSVHSSLRSSIILFDLSRVVEELVHNSIDANASKIDISVNVRASYVKVEDDGCGITRDELVLVGEKYATSKFHNVIVDGERSSISFGLNGEALASLSDISVVEVRTKARGRPNSYCKIIKGSKCSHLGIDEQREVVGTTVLVRELFYNQPVRRKQMQSSHKRELHLVKKCVLRVALIHPQVSLRLFDIESEDELLYTIPSSSPLPLVSNIFGNNVSNCLHEIATSDQHLALSGHISRPTDVFSNKDFQYLYINSRFVSKSPIHNMLNNLAYNFQPSLRNEAIDVRSKKRQKNKVYPAYLLNLCCPRSSYDLHFEPSQTVVEFKDWQTVMYFFERTITIYWKKHAPLPPEVKAIDNGAPLERDVKSNQDLLRHHDVQKEEDLADLYQTALLKNTVRDMNFDTGAPAGPKDSYLSLDMEPSTWHVCYDQISDASHTDDVARNGWKFDHKQICSLQSYSYQWLEDGSSLLEESDLSGASPTICKKQKTEDIFHGHAYSGNLELLQDAEIEIGPEIKLQESCFESHNKPNRMTCDFAQKQTNIEADVSGCDGFYVDFGKLNEDCLLNEISETITDVSCPQTSHFNDGFCPEDVGTSRSFCSVMKKSSKRQKNANAIPQMDFHDMQAVCESDYMDMSFIKDTCLHFYHPFSLADTPRSHSHARTDLELHGRSNKSINNWICENIGSDSRFTSDRFNIDSSIIFEGSKHLNNFGNGTRSPSYFNHEHCSVDQFASEQDQIPLKSKHDARMSYGISPEKSSTNCHLNVPFPQVANSSKLIVDQYGCGQRPRLSIGRYRSRSAPPFYRGKRKFPRLNEPLTKLTTEGGKDITVDDSEDITPAQEYTPHMNATQPIPETCSNEFSDLNFSFKGNVEMCEEKCSDELEDSTASDEITKWRDDSDHHTVLELQHGSFERYDDVLSISSGPLHLSCSVLVPECIDKNCFEEAKVLLQLDKKFIPVISGEVLLLVDQHAADERIRLEELRRKVLSDDARVITYLDSEEDLVLPETGFQLFQKYMQQIQKWGWIINSSSNSSESFKKNMNVLRRQSRLITLVAVPCILGVTLTGKDLMDFIQQLDETDGSSAIPPAVIRILNFKACRGAIMFGDPLLPSECSLIIEELKATSLCFQCAHGRPTTVPIVNVASLRDGLARLGTVSRRQAETWHGLSHNAPSLERARTRLKELRKLRGGLVAVQDVGSYRG